MGKSVGVGEQGDEMGMEEEVKDQVAGGGMPHTSD